MKVLLFARLREWAGGPEREVVLAPGARARDALEALRSAGPSEGFPEVPVVFAVNLEYVPPDRRLSEGDEVAILPPMAGG